MIDHSFVLVQADHKNINTPKYLTLQVPYEIEWLK